MGSIHHRGLAAILAIIASFIFSACGDKQQYAIIETPMGNMKVLLYDETPLHRDNFVKLANEGFYDDLLFHRVMQGFMIQGGDPESRNAAPNQMLGNGGPGYTLPAEIGAPHLRGALAAARLSDAMNPQKESSGSQFYVVQGRPVDPAMLDQFEQMGGFKYNETQRQLYQDIGGRPDLDGKYTVFGEVVEGLEVIDKIAAVQTNAQNRPVEDVPMKVYME